MQQRRPAPCGDTRPLRHGKASILQWALGAQHARHSFLPCFMERCRKRGVTSSALQCYLHQLLSLSISAFSYFEPRRGCVCLSLLIERVFPAESFETCPITLDANEKNRGAYDSMCQAGFYSVKSTRSEWRAFKQTGAEEMRETVMDELHYGYLAGSSEDTVIPLFMAKVTHSCRLFFLAYFELTS